MTIIQTLRSWFPKSKLDQAADEIHAALLQCRVRRGRNVGIDIPKGDTQLALVVQHTLKRHPDLTVVINPLNHTLVFKGDLQSLTSAELRESLVNGNPAEGGSMLGYEAVPVPDPDEEKSAPKAETPPQDETK